MEGQHGSRQHCIVILWEYIVLHRREPFLWGYGPIQHCVALTSVTRVCWCRPQLLWYTSNNWHFSQNADPYLRRVEARWHAWSRWMRQVPLKMHTFDACTYIHICTPTPHFRWASTTHVCASSIQHQSFLNTVKLSLWNMHTFITSYRNTSNGLNTSL